MKLNFSVIPEGDQGQIFSEKINVEKNSWNTLKSTQFFMLIPNMLLVGITSPMYLCQILVKKIENCVPIIVWWGLCEVTSFERHTILYHFQRLSVLYRYCLKIRNRYFVFVKKLSKQGLQISSFHLI